MVQGQICRHAIEPGYRLVCCLHFGKMLPGANECFLAQIACRPIVSHHPPEIASNAWLISAKESLEIAGDIIQARRLTAYRLTAHSSSLLIWRLDSQPSQN